MKVQGATMAQLRKAGVKAVKCSTEAARWCVALAKVGRGKPYLGVQSYVMVVQLASIHFDDYQRPGQRKHVENIANIFNPVAARFPLLSFRNGKLYSYDGGHTVRSMLRVGVTEFECVVTTGLTFEQEAELFYMLNQMPKKMNGWLNFRSAMMYGNEMYCRIFELCEKYHLTTPLTPGVTKRTAADVTNSTALLDAYRKGGEPLLEMVLWVLDKCWRTGPTRKSGVQEAAKSTEVLRGLTLFLQEFNDQLTLKGLQAVLSKVTADELTEAAKKQSCKTRADAKQYKMALQEYFKVNPRTMRKAA